MKLNFFDHSPDVSFKGLFPELAVPKKKKVTVLYEPVVALATAIYTALGYIGITGVGVATFSFYAAAATYAVVVGSFVYSYASGRKGKSGRSTALKTIDESGQLVNTRETSAPVKVVYGKTKVGGNWVFAEQTVSNSNLLNIVVSWGEGECDSVADSIDWVPQFTGTGYDDLRTGGEVATFTSCECDQTCYGYSACTCNVTCYNQSCDCNNTGYGVQGDPFECACYNTFYSCLTCYTTCYNDGGW